MGGLVGAVLVAVAVIGAVIAVASSPAQPDVNYDYPTDNYEFPTDFIYVEPTPFPTVEPTAEPTVEPPAETSPASTGSPADTGSLPSGGASGSPAGAGAVKLVATGNLATARTEHTATRLADGRVVIIGGTGANPNSVLDSVEIYNPAARKFSSGGHLRTPRSRHTATLLGDGRILVAGGMNRQGVPLFSAEIYDPVTRASSPVGDLNNSRYAASAALMKDGTVVIVGGADENGAVLTVERFDPRQGQFEDMDKLLSVYNPLPVVALPDGRLVLFGTNGIDGTAESLGMFDLSDSTLEPADILFTSDSRSRRWAATTCLLLDGRVLIAGGRNESGWAAALEVLDPSNFAGFLDSRPQPELVAPRENPTVTALQDGGALIAGGYNAGPMPVAEIERWDPETGVSTLVARMPQPRADHTATLLADGTVLIVGGRTSPASVLASALLALP